MSPSWENLDDFLQHEDAGGFATTADITLAGGQVLSGVVGLFDDPYMHAHAGEYENDALAPRFTCKLSSVPGVRRRDSVVIQGKAYDVLHDPESDGIGMAVLRLQPA